MESNLTILKEEEGFSFLETIVAIFLVMLLVTAFTGSFIMGLQSEAQVDSSLKAGSLAESIIEELNSRPEYISEIYKGSEESEKKIVQSVLDKNSSLESFEQNNIKNGPLIDAISREDINGNFLYTVEVYLEWEEGDSIQDFTLISRIRE